MIYHNWLKPSAIDWCKIPKMVTSQQIPRIITIDYVLVITYSINRTGDCV